MKNFHIRSTVTLDIEIWPSRRLHHRCILLWISCMASRLAMERLHCKSGCLLRSLAFVGALEFIPSFGFTLHELTKWVHGTPKKQGRTLPNYREESSDGNRLAIGFLQDKW